MITASARDEGGIINQPLHVHPGMEKNSKISIPNLRFSTDNENCKEQEGEESDEIEGYEQRSRGESNA
jgi:hypothetical protein